MMGLGDLPGGVTSSNANAISGDGTIVVGYSSSHLGPEAFYWTEPTGMIGLGVPLGGLGSIAYGISGDGSTVVGRSIISSDFEPIYWDAELEIHTLTQELLDLGLGPDLESWDLEEATAVSHSGLTIVGWGRNPDGDQEAWIAYLGQDPHPVEIPAVSTTGLILLAIVLVGASRRSSSQILSSRSNDHANPPGPGIAA